MKAQHATPRNVQYWAIGAALLSILAGAIPFAVAANGFATWIRYIYPLYLFYLLPVATVHELWMRVCARQAVNIWRFRTGECTAYGFALSFLVLMGSHHCGKEYRKWQARQCADKCQGIIDALDAAHRRNGEYLEDLSVIEKEIKEAEALGLQFLEEYPSVFDMESPLDFKPSAVIAHSSRKEYTLIVPVDVMYPMSFTRFYYYIYTSRSQKWTYTHDVWAWQSVH